MVPFRMTLTLDVLALGSTVISTPVSIFNAVLQCQIIEFSFGPDVSFVGDVIKSESEF